MIIAQEFRPLADRLRPATLDEYLGQTHLLAAGMPLRRAIESGSLYSMVFWGPPGTGKTTLARLLTAHADAELVAISAVLSGVREIREAIAAAQQRQVQQGRGTVLFVDEVHRFNKAQQDAFLPHIEDGTIIFIGATTENPSFELNNALLSRARVHVLKPLNETELLAVMRRALEDVERGLGKLALEAPDAQLQLIAQSAGGDARRALNLLEIAADLAQAQAGEGQPAVLDEAVLGEVLADGTRRFDKGGDVFYEQISALHKSVRGSAPDAALYWLVRMLDGGCDPLYLARRLVRIASEDIGNADPRALQLALNAWDAQQRLGSPEGELALAQTVLYLASAAKSNAVYVAYNAARKDVPRHGSHEVPVHLRNAPTRLLRELGYGRAYRYAHDEPDGYAAGESYFPDDMPQQTYYHPVSRGLEIRIAEKLARLRQLDAQYRAAPDENKSR